MKDKEKLRETQETLTHQDLTKVGEVDVSALSTMLGVTGTYLQNFARYLYSNIYFFSASRNNNTYVIRFQLSSGTFVPKDYVILSSYGHGESLEITDYNSSTDTYTIWIGEETNSDGYSRHIARIKYQVTNSDPKGAIVVSGQTKIITGLIDAAEGTSGVTEYRSTVGISPSGDNRICFTTRRKVNNVAGIYNIVYDFSNLNSALDSASSPVALSSFLSYRKSLFWISKSSAYPNDSYQGEDISGSGSNGKLYISGGHTNEDSKINRFSYNESNSYSLDKVYTIKTTTAPSGHDILNAEIEGIKIINEYSYDKMFIMFRAPGGANKFTVYKCSV